MQQVKKRLEARENYLSNIKNEKEKKLEEMPEGTLRICKHIRGGFSDYKNCVSITNIPMSIYKVAFNLTNWHLAFQLTIRHVIAKDSARNGFGLAK